MPIVDSAILKYVQSKIPNLDFYSDNILAYKSWWVICVSSTGEIRYRNDLKFSINGSINLNDPTSLNTMIADISNVISYIDKMENGILELRELTPANQYG